MTHPTQDQPNSSKEDLRDELINIPVRMGKKELGGILSAQEIDQILALFTHHQAAIEREARLNEALFIRYNAPDDITKDNWIGKRIALHQSKQDNLTIRKDKDE